MTFSTLNFLLVFLPALLLLYFCCPSRFMGARNGILLVFSLYFYAWGEPVYVLLIALSCSLTYLCSFWVQKKSRVGLILALGVNLLPLLVFKYLNFILLNISHLTGLQLPVLGLTMPIGISFYTFQIITYVVDLYRGQVKLQRNPAYLMLYVFFFPQLVAGPIVRYVDVEREIACRRFSWEDCSYGARRIILGLGKKMLLANPAGAVTTRIASLDQGMVGAGLLWVSVLCYGVQIFFDFSAYSDMAIGLGRLFGFHFLENFNRPYTARSITDFWRRWHISLSTFFRDYIYIPLGGNRLSVPRHIFNLFVVWFLTGLWHGASWNFALWGVYYFVLLTLEKYVCGKYLARLPGWLSRAITFFFYMLGWAIFLYESNSFAEIIRYLARLFGAAAPLHPLSLRGAGVQGNVLIAALGLYLSMASRPRWVRALQLSRPRLFAAARDIGLLALLCVSVCFIVGSSFNPFIYFRF